MTDQLERVRLDYVGRLRRSLAGVSADVADEAVAEIEAHIEDALADRHDRGMEALLDVLERLGPPEVYARDLGLYLMVDRGYRNWSVRHMIGSARFWAMSTAAGAVVVLIFGLLYGLALAVTAAGAAKALLSDALEMPLGAALAGVPPLLLLAGGPLALLTITFVLRWFIGQYVVWARPLTRGGEAADAAWVARASRTILALAIAGLVVTVAAGLVAGAVRSTGTALVLELAPVAWTSPPAIVGFGGLVLFFLAPVIGLVWTVAEARRRGSEGVADEFGRGG